MGRSGGLANPVLKVLRSSKSQKVENGLPVTRAPAGHPRVRAPEAMPKFTPSLGTVSKTVSNYDAM
jgi:hypothetical protein